MGELTSNHSEFAAFEPICAQIAEKLGETYAHVRKEEELRIRIDDVEITFDPHPDKVILTPFIMDDVFPAVLYTGEAHECPRNAALEEFAIAIDGLIEKTRNDWRYSSAGLGTT